jgi:hypothetical protein
MKKNRWIGLVVSALFLSSVASCQRNNTENSSTVSDQSAKNAGYVLTAPSVFNLPLNDSSYNFGAGVSLTKEGDVVSFTVDTSGIDFTKKGTYSVSYLSGNYRSSVPVKVFSAPNITGAATATHFVYQDKNKVVEGFTAVDCFGTSLPVEADYAGDAIGRVALGEQNAKVYCLDAAGNRAEMSVSVTIEQGTSISIPDLTLDLAAPENSIVKRGTYTNAHLAKGLTLLSDSEFLLESKIAKSYLKSLGAGTYVFTFLCEEGYTDFTLTLTDKEAPEVIFDYSYEGAKLLEGEASLPTFALLDEDSYQNITLHYSLSRDGVSVSLDSALEEGSYVYSVSVIRGGLVVESKQLHFSVLKDFEYYGLAANAYSKISISGADMSASMEEGAIKVTTGSNCSLYHPCTLSWGADLVDEAKAAGRTVLDVSFYAKTDVPQPYLYDANMEIIKDANGNPSYDNTLWFGPTDPYGGFPELSANVVYTLSVGLDRFTAMARSLNLIFHNFVTLYFTGFSFLSSPLLPNGYVVSLTENSDSSFHVYRQAKDTHPVPLVLNRSLVDQAISAGKSKMILTLLGHESDTLFAGVVKTYSASDVLSPDTFPLTLAQGQTLSLEIDLSELSSSTSAYVLASYCNADFDIVSCVAQ